jgi:hypothetical protein
MMLNRQDAKNAMFFILLRPRAQQNPLRPFGGVNVR